ncbi:unnamed protein product [[Candida] boidinii]|nr:transferase activity, transferring acyl groups protein [[Candida] boidinii]OWB86276.1 transferase activity, transferring acyl groups protein [[Candida] boidinii]GME93574.1 unnamed protein product [[Candida] boidinii]GMF99472.1 unnamed protein product [[Candida] boidinii]
MARANDIMSFFKTRTKITGIDTISESVSRKAKELDDEDDDLRMITPPASDIFETIEPDNDNFLRVNDLHEPKKYFKKISINNTKVSKNEANGETTSSEDDEVIDLNEFSGSKRLKRNPKMNEGKLKKKKRTIQMHFDINLLSKSNKDKSASAKNIVCNKCHMSYVPHIQADSQLHDKFHQRSFEGLNIPYNTIKTFDNYETATDIFHKKDGKEYEFKIIEINPKNYKECNLGKEYIEICNTELNAPNDTSKWLHGSNFGKMFVLISISKHRTNSFGNSTRAVGFVSLERITKGKWMVLESSKIVPNQEIPLVIGISRIYVSKNWRGFGLGMDLLNVLPDNSVYGMTLKKSQIGWSQPSESGSRLAHKFSSFKHKSGKTLIPVYVEE